jgi:hypothetical protein
MGLGLKLTTDYFGARDGRQRSEPAPAPVAVEASADAPRAGESTQLTAGAIAAASLASAAPAAPAAPATSSVRREGAVAHA